MMAHNPIGEIAEPNREELQAQINDLDLEVLELRFHIAQNREQPGEEQMDLLEQQVLDALLIRRVELEAQLARARQNEILNRDLFRA